MEYNKLFFKKPFVCSCFLFICKQICDNIWLQFKNKSFQILNFRAFKIDISYLIISKFSYICHWKIYLFSNLFKTFHLLTDVMSNMCFIWFRFFFLFYLNGRCINFFIFLAFILFILDFFLFNFSNNTCSNIDYNFR